MLEWAGRLQCGECGSREVDFVVCGERRQSVGGKPVVFIAWRLVVPRRYSITSSARARIDGGIPIPSAFAVA